MSRKRYIIGTGYADWKTLSSAEYIKRLMDIHIYLEVVIDAQKQHTFRPLFDYNGQPYAIGSEVDLVSVCFNHSLPQNQHRNLTWNTDSDILSLIVITQMYKNDVKGITRELEAIRNNKEWTGFWIGVSFTFGMALIFVILWWHFSNRGTMV